MTTNEKKTADTRGRQRSHTLQYKPQRRPTPRPPTSRPLIPQIFEQSLESSFQDVTEEWASKMLLDDISLPENIAMHSQSKEVNSSAK